MLRKPQYFQLAPCAAELFVSMFRSFKARIANTISSYK